MKSLIFNKTDIDMVLKKKVSIYKSIFIVYDDWFEKD